MAWSRKKIYKAISNVEVPNNVLDKVDFVIIRVKKDIEKISDGGGCYWIWTDKPVLHSLHTNLSPKAFKGVQIIYNGIAKDNVKKRIQHHIFGHEKARWSGISMDIYKKNHQRVLVKKHVLQKERFCTFVKHRLGIKDY
ncbi:MAG: hypothetical protein FJ214_09050 [Ignavibacteria bacterium]|nr:hypothetical protein [Ignavibacteria bacterium]